jgi:hypothetical protein
MDIFFPLADAWTRTGPRISLPRGDHDRLDGVHAVLGLIKDDRVPGFKDLVGHLHAIQSKLLVDLLTDLGLAIVEGRQTMQRCGFGDCRPFWLPVSLCAGGWWFDMQLSALSTM